VNDYYVTLEPRSPFWMSLGVVFSIGKYNAWFSPFACSFTTIFVGVSELFLGAYPAFLVGKKLEVEVVEDDVLSVLTEF